MTTVSYKKRREIYLALHMDEVGQENAALTKKPQVAETGTGSLKLAKAATRPVKQGKPSGSNID